MEAYPELRICHEKIAERIETVSEWRTPRGAAFYWLAILLTFALGAAAGDFPAELLNLGYLLSVVVFASRSWSSSPPTSGFA